MTDNKIVQWARQTGLALDPEEEAVKAYQRAQKRGMSQEDMDRAFSEAEARTNKIMSGPVPTAGRFLADKAWEYYNKPSEIPADAVRVGSALIGGPVGTALTYLGMTNDANAGEKEILDRQMWQRIREQQEKDNRARGGRLLQDQYPTHYLPHVGRQVMQDGGDPNDPVKRAMAVIPAANPLSLARSVVSEQPKHEKTKHKKQKSNVKTTEGSVFRVKNEEKHNTPSEPQQKTEKEQHKHEEMHPARSIPGFHVRHEEVGEPIFTDIEHKAGGGEVDDGITAYHGSPHDFEKFDISKIGTGEGAQAFGHGLYFAEAEPVAQGYKKQLAQDFVHVDGKKIPHPSEENPESDHIYRLANHMYQMGHTTDEAIEDAIRRAEKLKPNLDSEDFYKAKEAKKAQDWADQISYLKGKHIEWKKDPGHMYEVHINAHPDHFLDWDKPILEQNHVIKAIDQYLGDPEIVLNRLIGHENGTGKDLYNALGGNYKSEAVSNKLHEMGIKGIKYLDHGSRGAGEGSRNYVVFDDKLVNVKRKYEDGGTVN